MDTELSNLILNSSLLGNVRSRVRDPMSMVWFGKRSGRRREGLASYSGPFPLPAGPVGYPDDLG